MWVRIDDQFARHPKVLAVSRAARWVHVAAMCYAGEYLTDGFIPRRIALQIAIEDEGDDPGRLIQELLGGGLWELVAGGYQIHDYLEYNPSREEVEADRAKEKARQDRARVKAGRDPDSNQFSVTPPVTPPVTTSVTPPVTTSVTPPVTHGVRHSVPVPVPVPVPDPVPQADRSDGGSPTRGDVDNSAEGRPLRASASGKPKPKTPGLGTPEKLTEEQADRLDELRAKLERRFPRDAGRIQRVVVQCVGRGEPFEAIERALDHAVRHCDRDPEGYIARVVGIEGPNVHATRSEAAATGFKQAMDGLGLRSLQEAAERAAQAQGGPHPP